MEYLHSFFDDKITEPTALTVGKFDGIHKGHELLNRLILEKKEYGLKSAIITFENTPRISLNKDCTPSLITNEERMFKLKSEGLDYLVECPFDDKMMKTLPEDFIRILVERFNMKYIAVGSDFRFGYKGLGNATLLEQLSTKYEYEVKIIDKIKKEDRDISSTYIREELLNGNISLVNDMLGYEYFVWGRVVHGAHLGHKIGIPTINIVPPDNKLVPRYGVYVTSTLIDGKEYHGVTNVGMKPTVTDERRVGIETHILDFNSLIYGENVKVTFKSFIRGEQKFNSIEELKKQMNIDKKKAIAYFNK
ncbi:MAG: bifunctional riboflavin kinase/FAD synthetase [Pseudobutyrivibrio sp.]|nr:bifunctional riboflavin kinase/FAD synthetase [Pseudobutyrivibrio sp.]